MATAVLKVTEPAWFKLAVAEIGTVEGVGDLDNPKVLAYYRDAGHPEIDHDAVAWCAAFACAILERAGFRSPRSLAARSFLQWGKELSEPYVGCIAVLSRGKSSWEGHVGFVAQWDEKNVWLVGGNQGDAVKVQAFPRSRVLGFREPITPENSRTIAAAKTSVVSSTVSAMSQAASAAIPAPDVLAQMADAGSTFAGTLSGLSQFLPLMGAVAAIIGGVSAAVCFYARMDDLAKKGR